MLPDLYKEMDMVGHHTIAVGLGHRSDKMQISPQEIVVIVIRTEQAI